MPFKKNKKTTTTLTLTGNMLNMWSWESPEHSNCMLALLHRSYNWEHCCEYWTSVTAGGWKAGLVGGAEADCERGLAFRGNDELFGSPHNGNFLGRRLILYLHKPYEHKSMGSTSTTSFIHYMWVTEPENSDTEGKVVLCDYELHCQSVTYWPTELHFLICEQRKENNWANSFWL